MRIQGPLEIVAPGEDEPAIRLLQYDNVQGLSGLLQLLKADGSPAPLPPLGAIANPAYSASITPDAGAGNWATITVTNGTAFTINAPTGAPASNRTASLTVEIYNNSGGVMGAITWNSAFVLVAGALTVPANTKKRFITFQWNGTKWIEIARAGADY